METTQQLYYIEIVSCLGSGMLPNDKEYMKMDNEIEAWVISGLYL